MIGNPGRGRGRGGEGGGRGGNGNRFPRGGGTYRGRGNGSTYPNSRGNRAYRQNQDQSTVNGDNQAEFNGDNPGNEPQNGNGRRFPFFGFKKLYGFLNEKPDNVILAIEPRLEEWGQFIENKMVEDVVVLLINVLGEKVVSTESVLNQLKINIVSKTLNETFYTRCNEKTRKMLMSVDPVPRQPRNENDLIVDHSRNRILRNLHNLSTFVVNKMTTTAIDYIQKILPGIIAALSVSYPSEEIDLLKKDFSELRDTIVALEEKRRQKHEESKERGNRRYGFTDREEETLHGMEPPDDFREIPIVPSKEEIMSLEEAFLRPNKKYGAYIDADHYLDVHYRLLREDFVKPLKTGIQDFLKYKHDYLTRKRKMPIGNVRIYPDVQILEAQLVKDEITYKVQLPENIYKRIKWDRSKRLLPGSMVVFTADDFRTAYFGMVAQHDRRNTSNASGLSNGIFGVVWEGATAPELERKGEEFLMIECEVYFEAYRHNLQILKELKLTEFPMAKFIVNGSSDVGPPAYMDNCTHMLKLEDNYISPLQGPWPNAKELRLDETQFEAFHSALTKEFAIIQGPPGTGKTFLGLKITDVLLNNLQMWWGEGSKDGHGPILVVCYTNHALDQFCEGILDLLENIFPGEDPAMIRVGGRSKSERMQEFSLARKRQVAAKLHLYDQNYWHSKREAVQYVRNCEFARAETMQEVVALTNPDGIIDFTSLEVWTGTSLQEDFPKEVWQILKDPGQLGIKESFFESPNFTPDQLFNRWFQLMTAPPPQKPSTSQQRFKAEQPAVEQEDDEDYDLEELLENRCIDDILIESEVNSITNEGKSHVQYLGGVSIREFEKNLRNSVTAKLRIDHDPKMSPVERHIRRDEVEKKSRISENQKSFLQELFQHHKANRINLPLVNNILNPQPGAPGFSGLTYAEKWALYFAVVERARILSMQLANTQQQKLIDAQKKLKDILNYGDGFLLRQTKVVGMTTTGAAKYNHLLKMMKSKIVIVEEAAEVLEAHIVTCITEYCQHLILIGDHQQLKPSTTVYELAKRYNLDISLFERMLNNNLHCSKLKVQHRMRPEICDLIVGPIYKELENHISVRDYEPVLGTEKNLFFISHDQKEKSESDSMSKENPHEAKFLSALCRYLVQQGYSTNRITILTTYTGQMFLIKNEIRKLPTCQGVRVTVVDNFQGEENDIILLSLVRSNEQNNIGFLKTDNRICVAISRAKHGLFICGNMDTLLASRSKTWEQIQKKLLARNEIGDSLELVCQIHHTSTLVKSSTDFTRVPEGGCNVLCATGLKCGHICESVCHIHDREHNQYKCRQRCEKKCKNEHQCQDRCFKDCPLCPVKMMKTLPCAHVQLLACHVKEESIKCMEIVLRVLPCGHAEQLPCSQDPQKYKCKIKVTKQLTCTHEKKNVECFIEASTIQCKQIVDKVLIPCGHIQKEACHLHPEMVKCHTMVEKKMPGCGHMLQVECQFSNKPVYCKAACSVRLECGHACTRICHVDEDPDHLNYECHKECGRICVNGHECSTGHKCSTPCPPCEVLFEKTLSCVVHKSEVKCHVDPATVECLHPCNKMIPRCGHTCESLCYQPCEPCMIRVEKLSPCGHFVEVPCSEAATQAKCEKMVKPVIDSPCNHDTLVPCKLRATIKPEDIPNYCTQPCGYEFKKSEGGCEHRCAGTCAGCRQGRLHIKCQEECGRPLVCGHVCKAPCAATSCPPCQQECVLKCEHSACNKICGEPCTGCAEPCTWKCEHKQCLKRCREVCERDPCDEPCAKKLKCGHDCIGFCGEPCPHQCRICDNEELTDFILMGNEDEDDARFVFLEDCGHAIEHTGLEYHLVSGAGSQGGEILAKTCPKCKTVVRRSRRYGNLLRDSLKDVVAVKAKVYGNPEHLRRRRAKIVNEVRGNRSWQIGLPGVYKFLLDKLIIVVPPRTSANKTERIIEKNVDINTVTSLEKVVEHGKDVLKLLEDEDSALLTPFLRESWLMEYRKLFKLLTDRVPLNAIEVRDFDREFDRLYDLRQIYLRKSSPRFTDGHSTATPIYNRVLSIIWAPRVYTKQMKDDIMRQLKEIDDSIRTGLGISDRERRDILNAIGMASGRWFKCPNGHIYIITECGGAVEQRKCSECDAMIGGGNHMLRSDNALATEMDGATQPLYPNMV